MDRLPFIYSRDGDVCWAKFVSADERPVHEHWHGLNGVDAIEDIDNAHWHRLAINNNNCEEVAAYLRLAWQLVVNREVIGNALYWTEDASKALGQPGEVVNWQFETCAYGPPGHAVIKGFTPGRSCVQIHPTPPAAQRWMRDKSRIFRIHGVLELAALLRSVLLDAAGEVSLFGTTETGVHRIIERLAGRMPPAMSDLLADDDVFVSIRLGVDHGYNDAIFVASLRPLEAILEPVRIGVERAIADYEAALGPNVSPMEALRLMERLAGA